MPVPNGDLGVAGASVPEPMSDDDGVTGRSASALVVETCPAPMVEVVACDWARLARLAFKRLNVSTLRCLDLTSDGSGRMADDMSWLSL